MPPRPCPDARGDSLRTPPASLGTAAGCCLLCFLLAGALAAQTLDDGRALQRAGRLDEALTAYAAVAARLDSLPADAAVARNNSCAILMNRGDYRAAVEQCRAALPLRRAAGDERGLGRTLNNLGLVLRFLGEFDEAERRFAEALAINRRLGDGEAEAINLANLGVLAESRGSYAAAIDYHRQVEELAGSHAGEPWAARQIAIARVNQGVVLVRVSAFHEALELLEGVDESQLAADERAQLAENRGVVYRNLGDPASAGRAYQAAEALYSELGNDSARANVLLNLALVDHLNLRRPKAAEANLRAALALVQRTGDLQVELQILYFLGDVLLAQRRDDDAEQAFSACLALAGDRGSAEGRWSALEGLARVAAGRDDLDLAYARASEAIAIIEQVRASLRSVDLGTAYFGARRPIYSLAVDILARRAAVEPAVGYERAALELAERAKARDLLDALGTPRRQLEPLATSAIQALLGDDLLLEYFAGESHLYAWAVTRDQVVMRDLGPAAPLLDAVGKIYETLASGGRVAPADLTALSEGLLGPSGALPLAAGSWRVVPDRRLHYLPFEILDDPSAPGRPLIDRARVTYLPSASALAARPESARPAPALTLAGLGDPAIAEVAGRTTLPGLLTRRFRLGPLPAAARELEAARRALGGRVELRLGSAATEAAFRELAAGGARVLHLVAHTVVDERPGQGAAILLTESGDDDGLLRPAEIAGLDYRADLTVLAACRSALGAGGGGAGDGGGSLASLTGSFLAAGSSAVVATLWDVGDEAAATFMEQFYYRLGRGEPPAEALREAKVELRSDPRWQDPWLWAPYVLVGQAPPVAAGRRAEAWAVGAALLLLAVLLLALRARARGGRRS